jgi:predicted transcriptional regulator
MNIFDINLEYSLFDVIISITLFVLSFIAFFYFGYFRDLKERVKENHKFKDMLIDGYIRKFDEYNDIISELRTKIDMIELRINPEKSTRMEDEIVGSTDAVDERSHKNISHNVTPEIVGSTDAVDERSHKNISHNVTPVMKSVIITDKKDDIRDDVALHLNTVNSILKMLEVPLTSREIQGKINKSREHTSRLLKKLYSENIVIRDETTRPFRYKITNEGRKLLEQTTSSPG